MSSPTLDAGSPGDTLAHSVIGQIAIFVHDLDRAVAFYRDTLGLLFLFQVPGLAFFDCGGVRLMLDAAAQEENPSRAFGTSVIYYKVPDLQQSCDALARRGVRWTHAPHLVAQMPDHDLWMAFCDDSEGNMLALMSEVRPPAARG
ncbi:MAG TPA: VOC family protein [Dehalococcoidia bacterium]|nr:VOC family protein [Dehalococcoidia bacterium]